MSHFSRYAVLAYDKAFEDVQQRDWAYPVIRKLAAKHIINGVSASRFDPKANVTRAEFATFIARALQLDITGMAAGFEDIMLSDWYAGAVAATHNAGIVKGLSATELAPNDAITRQEMAVMLMHAYAYQSSKAVTDAPAADFSDEASISNAVLLGSGLDGYMIWGDYYYFEALMRLERGVPGYWYER
ncbi:S-layer homology domain-containing protein [Cohnella yongneupensis]|uniref:S-layer homology domain-containing protein n=1 Tax=Cohnella yongneupensis TaxID=425006 RepID=A0ABW0QZ67_9BACL